LNIILLEKKQKVVCLDRQEKIAIHILSVLKAKKGDSIDVGVKNGSKGKAFIREISKNKLCLEIKWSKDKFRDLYPVILLVGLSRPQTCRKILEQASSMGVEKMHFFICEKSEPSYGKSRLWTTNEWEERIVNGVEQAFSTFIPECKLWDNLISCLDSLNPGGDRIALDNYESFKPLSYETSFNETNCHLAVGPERGWSGKERVNLREAGFTLLSLGPRVLRQETAVVVGLGHALHSHWVSNYKSL